MTIHRNLKGKLPKIGKDDPTHGSKMTPHDDTLMRERLPQATRQSEGSKASHLKRPLLSVNTGISRLLQRRVTVTGISRLLQASKASPAGMKPGRANVKIGRGPSRLPEPQYRQHCSAEAATAREGFRISGLGCGSETTGPDTRRGLRTRSAIRVSDVHHRACA